MGSEEDGVVVVVRRKAEKSSKLLPGRSCQRYIVCKIHTRLVSNFEYDLSWYSIRAFSSQTSSDRTHESEGTTTSGELSSTHWTVQPRTLRVIATAISTHSQKAPSEKTRDTLASFPIFRFGDEGGARALILTVFRRKMMSKRTTWVCCRQGRSVVDASERWKGGLIVDRSIDEDEGRWEVGRTVRKKKQNGRRCHFFFSLASRFLVSLPL